MTRNEDELRADIDELNKEGLQDNGDGGVEYMEVVKEADLTSSRVKKLMEAGMSEENAKKEAVRQTEERAEGKLGFSDIATYVRYVNESSLSRHFTMCYMHALSGSFDTDAFCKLFNRPGVYIESGGINGVWGIFYLTKDGAVRFIPHPGEGKKYFGKDVTVGGKDGNSDFYNQLSSFGFVRKVDQGVFTTKLCRMVGEAMTDKERIDALSRSYGFSL